MRKIFVSFILFFVSFSFAADPAAVRESASALVGAINGALDDPLGVVTYIPGYGLHIAARATFEEKQIDETKDVLVNLLTSLGSTVKGLEPNDWISIGYRGNEQMMDDGYELLVRLYAANGVVEVWLNGQPY